MLLSVLAMCLMISSNDLVALYMAIEFQSLCFYVLAASRRTSMFSVEAGIKYFLIGALASGFLLFGCTTLYGFTGMTNLSQIQDFVAVYADLNVEAIPKPITVGMLCLLVSMFLKVGAVPFHMWVPDVYEGSPTHVTAFFAMVPKVALMSLFMKLFLCTLSPLMVL